MSLESGYQEPGPSAACPVARESGGDKFSAEMTTLVWRLVWSTVMINNNPPLRNLALSRRSVPDQLCRHNMVWWRLREEEHPGEVETGLTALKHVEEESRKDKWSVLMKKE